MRVSTKRVPARIAALAVAAALVPAAMPSVALAQDLPQITVTPRDPGGTGYYGAYGAALPGVYMLTNSGLPVGPNINEGQVRLPSKALLENGYTYAGGQLAIPGVLPIIDAWHGTAGPGFAF